MLGPCSNTIFHCFFFSQKTAEFLRTNILLLLLSLFSIFFILCLIKIVQIYLYNLKSYYLVLVAALVVTTTEVITIKFAKEMPFNILVMIDFPYGRYQRMKEKKNSVVSSRIVVRNFLELNISQVHQVRKSVFIIRMQRKAPKRIEFSKY